MKLLATAAATAAALGALAACGPVTTHHHSPGPDVTTHSTDIGAVLADSGGHTLYVLNKNDCTGGCLSAWPAADAHGKLSKSSGVLATIAAPVNGQLMVNGLKVYTYAPDAHAGDVNGQGVTDVWGTWHVLDVNGHVVWGDVVSATPPTGGPSGW